jgi:hypothetical protein
MDITFTLLDLVQIGLMLGACYACFRWGHHKGVVDTVDFFESEGIIKVEDADS